MKFIRFAQVTLIGLVCVPFALLVCVARWAVNSLGDAWDELP